MGRSGGFGTWRVFGCCLALWLFALPPARAADAGPKVYVVLWIVTEDYILLASDDAALRLADSLSRQQIRANFLVVGEKARVLEQRGRSDVIAALRKHEIGFHGNFHSVHPTPASYLSNLSWDEGVTEFDRRERPGYDSIRRILGTAPTSYCQPGGSWAPQAYGTLRQWDMPVHLGTGTYVSVEDRPHYYGGVLNLFGLPHTFSTDLTKSNALKQAEDRFLAARAKLLADNGGVISLYYHECEFVHKDYWDGINFRRGANPPREQWKQPPTKTAEQSKVAYEAFEGFMQYIKRFPDVQFITTSEAAKLYRDKAQDRQFSLAELKEIAGAVGENISFQKRTDYALSAAEVFMLLNGYLVEKSAGRNQSAVPLRGISVGPSQPAAALAGPITTDASQFQRTAVDVADFLQKQGRIPSTVWLGSVAVPPESYLCALGQVTRALIDGKPMPSEITIHPAHLTASRYVADDAPRLWDWVILPPGMKAPAMMELAKRQGWTLKPALLDQATPKKSVP